jgi:hypothetical protein
MGTFNDTGKIGPVVKPEALNAKILREMQIISAESCILALSSPNWNGIAAPADGSGAPLDGEAHACPGVPTVTTLVAGLVMLFRT